MKITLVEKIIPINKRKASQTEEKTSISDDPIRMYLREMGGVDFYLVKVK